MSGCGASGGVDETEEESWITGLLIKAGSEMR